MMMDDSFAALFRESRGGRCSDGDRAERGDEFATFHDLSPQ